MLVRPCPECGYDGPNVGRDEVADLLRSTAAGFVEVLHRQDVTERPAPTVWSPLEYACHVRDVYRLFGERLALMLAEDDPPFENWDQDATAVQERYGEQDPAVVSRELAEAGERLAQAFEAVGDEQWSRTGGRSDGARFTVETLGRYLCHDPVHHLVDVGHR